MKSLFIENNSVHIHVLDNNGSRDVPTLLVIEGIWESCERAIPILSNIKSHVISLSLRGRGLSSTPQHGYDLSHHLSDVEAVVKHYNLKNYCILGFSRGASYALGWTLKHEEDMSGLILVDQPPIHTAASEGFIEYWSNLKYLGVPLLNYIRKDTLIGLDREAVQVDFTSNLSKIKIPVSLFIGRNEDSQIPSNVSNETLEVYKNHIQNLNVVEFKKSGHMIPDDEEEKYMKEIENFLHSGISK